MTEGRDYQILPNGLLVMTALYLSERGYCCGNGCYNCPFDYEKVPEPKKTLLIQKRVAQGRVVTRENTTDEQGSEK